jgi:MOSC domain-containing protein YiiM
MAKILAVCQSKEKGTTKKIIESGLFKEGFGLIDDAHASSAWHRQVSLLAIESIQKMRDMGFNVGSGDFAENLTTEGINLVSLPIGTHVAVGDEIILEISQIGKECHSGCAIMQQTGKCIMPKEGVFAKVIRGGTAKAGDAIKVVNKGCDRGCCC